MPRPWPKHEPTGSFRAGPARFGTTTSSCSCSLPPTHTMATAVRADACRSTLPAVPAPAGAARRPRPRLPAPHAGRLPCSLLQTPPAPAPAPAVTARRVPPALARAPADAACRPLSAPAFADAARRAPVTGKDPRGKCCGRATCDGGLGEATIGWRGRFGSGGVVGVVTAYGWESKS